MHETQCAGPHRTPPLSAAKQTFALKFDTILGNRDRVLLTLRNASIDSRSKAKPLSQPLQEECGFPMEKFMKLIRRITQLVGASAIVPVALCDAAEARASIRIGASPL